ncbi:hypothetical protein [Amycolatopsis vastitatis]|uniref:hypothetical protein n=1 Tax=Amycolatopsis vastitatis TaxID=1905142 RepID=UPI00196A6AAB|nr:hypothetical protein [Amycolatopsis vastitatis]
MAWIVCVHGIGQQVAGEQSLLRDWAPALLDGLTRAGHGGAATADDVVMGFYGDLFRPAGERLAVGDPMFTVDDVELACTRLTITALTEAGEQRVRVWRCAEPLTARATADRVRWQCEGWLTVRDGDRPSAGIVRLTLDPEEVVGGQALQLQFGAIGQDADAAERAGRALVRIQGLLGPDAVYTPLLDGGRGPAERVRLVPWGEPRRPVLEDRPWPGRLPVPSPALVPSGPVSAAVFDVVGNVVHCNERSELSSPPATVAIGDGPPRRVLGWQTSTTVVRRERYGSGTRSRGCWGCTPRSRPPRRPSPRSLSRVMASYRCTCLGTSTPTCARSSLGHSTRAGSCSWSATRRSGRPAPCSRPWRR